MSVGLAWKSAAKSNKKLVNQKYQTLFLSWMAFSIKEWKEALSSNQKIIKKHFYSLHVLIGL